MVKVQTWGYICAASSVSDINVMLHVVINIGLLMYDMIPLPLVSCKLWITFEQDISMALDAN